MDAVYCVGASQVQMAEVCDLVYRCLPKKFEFNEKISEFCKQLSESTDDFCGKNSSLQNLNLKANNILGANEKNFGVIDSIHSTAVLDLWRGCSAEPIFLLFFNSPSAYLGDYISGGGSPENVLPVLKTWALEMASMVDFFKANRDCSALIEYEEFSCYPDKVRDFLQQKCDASILNIEKFKLQPRDPVSSLIGACIASLNKKALEIYQQIQSMALLATPRNYRASGKEGELPEELFSALLYYQELSRSTSDKCISTKRQVEASAQLELATLHLAQLQKEFEDRISSNESSGVYEAQLGEMQRNLKLKRMECDLALAQLQSLQDELEGWLDKKDWLSSPTENISIGAARIYETPALRLLQLVSS